MKILVADDEPVFREIMKAILGKWPQHQFMIVGDGEAAWALLNDTGRSFDVAFLDVNMPGIGGIALLKRLRESMFYRALHIVICTAANDRATIAEAIKTGTKHYLVKPCTAEIISAKLAQIEAAEQKRPG